MFSDLLAVTEVEQFRSAGGAMYEGLSLVVVYLGGRDQCDIYNLSGAEVAYRYLLLAEHYCDKRAAEHVRGREATDETVAFIDISRSAPVVRPSLRDSDSTEFERVSGIKKNARKLREDPMAQAKAMSKKKGVKNHDDE